MGHQDASRVVVVHLVEAMVGPPCSPEVATAERAGTAKAARTLPCLFLCLLLETSSLDFDTFSEISGCVVTDLLGNSAGLLDSSTAVAVVEFASDVA